MGQSLSLPKVPVSWLSLEEEQRRNFRKKIALPGGQQKMWQSIISKCRGSWGSGERAGLQVRKLGFVWVTFYLQLPWWFRQSRVSLQCGRPGFNPSVGKTLWRRKWQPTLVFLPRKIPWMQEPGRRQSMGSQRVGHDWETNTRLGVFFSRKKQKMGFK